MANSDIQDIVDEIATALGKGVSVDDLSGRLVTYSAQQGRADEARIRSLLTRAVPDDIRAWQDEHGVATATKPVEVPANPDLGMRARLCVPLMHHGVKTGTLWILQSDDTWSAPALLGQLARLTDRIDTLAALQYDKADPQLEERRNREATFQHACRADPTALDDLRSWPVLYALDTVHVLVCLPTSAHDPARRSDAEATQLRVALHQTLAAHSHVLATSVQDTHTTVLVRSSRDADTPLQLHHDLTTAVATTAGHADTPPPVFVGVSNPLKTIERLPEAFQQAVIAAQAAAVDPELGSLAGWDDIGPYRFLARNLRRETLHQSELHDRLYAADDSGDLLHTLEVYYDTASVNEVARRLHLHRTSLYYRLGRIKDAIGTDPLDGPTRLELHMAIKAARWSRRPRI
ncbi:MULTISPECIES: helix-turn-helix domain-containing protein [unclassified Streptomyces]|uniref:PucR family transcriptional regulator n=1 Tax=unclassified Streptomyces TaxID=2593676 RepID=UPI0023669A4A|nr:MULTISPECIES: helix-turn-helix domain-containing protein [unclassified Streptomyces]MDF3144596.1 helix-turn-helix domain-containing protein [Streptomyces sp. T21Q-yed]WDF38892.1 helix-turn-helix domain-containing protein [Streptomyces sp. T12]